MNRLAVLLACGITLLATGTTTAGNWPAWRGADGRGISTDTHLPVTFGPSTNVTWKAPLAGAGNSTPIIWNDRIFTVSTLEDKGERVLFCLNRDDGASRWQKTVFKAPLETIHRLNSRASSTPSTDGKLVYATFLKVDGRTVPAPNVGSPRPITPGTILVVAYDLDGNLRWKREVGEFISAHGFNTCPVLYKEIGRAHV